MKASLQVAPVWESFASCQIPVAYVTALAQHRDKTIRAPPAAGHFADTLREHGVHLSQEPIRNSNNPSNKITML